MGWSGAGVRLVGSESVRICHEGYNPRDALPPVTRSPRTRRPQLLGLVGRRPQIVSHNQPQARPFGT
jgi:hypothetical protein